MVRQRPQIRKQAARSRRRTTSLRKRRRCSTRSSERSTRRDVELSFFVLSTDEGVRAQLDDEQRRLCAHAREADAHYDAHDDGEAQAWGHARIQRASLMQSLMARVGAVAMRSFF